MRPIAPAFIVSTRICPEVQAEELALTQQKQEFQKISKTQHNREGRYIFICHVLFYSYTLWVRKSNCLGMFATCSCIPGTVEQEDETIVFLY